MNFDKRLIYLRKQRNLLQADVAKSIGIGRATYGAYEQGKRQPDFDTLDKLAKFYEVSADYILGRTDIKNSVSNISKSDSEDKDFEEWLKNPDLNVFYRELPKSEEDKIRQLREIWEIIKKQ